MHSFRFLFLIAIVLVFCHRAGHALDEDTAIAETTVPKILKVTTWNDMPYSGYTMLENKTLVGTGHAFYILDLLSRKLNFTYHLVPPSAQIIGGEINGVMGQLYKKEVDVAVAFLPVIPSLYRLCEFSTPLDESMITAIMKRPQESATGSGLLAPFDNTVWLLVLAAILFVAPVIYIFALVRSKLWSEDAEYFSLPSCFWFVYSSLLKQGTNIIATSDSTRMLFATWWVFILILTSFYTANLTAFLTKPQFTLPINSLKDIVDKGYKWVTFKGRTIDYLLHQEDENELYTLKRTAGYKGSYITSYNNQDPAVINTINNHKLYLGESHYLQTLLFQDYLNKTKHGLEHPRRCSYVVMPGSILVRNRAFAFPHNSSLLRIFNKELLKIVEAGIIDHCKTKDLPLAEVCPVDFRTNERQLRNADLSLTYKVVGAGYGIAGISFILEYLLNLLIKMVKRMKDKRTVKTKRRKLQDTVDPPPEPVYTVDNYFGGKRPNLLKRSPPPMYQNVVQSSIKGKKQSINGRDYYIVIENGGERRLIPVRTPSAFLFQYTA